MYQTLMKVFNQISGWFVGLGESIVEARLRQAEFYMYGKCRTLEDIERVSVEEKQKTTNDGGVHWQ